MNRKSTLVGLLNGFWGKVILVSVIFFFVYLGDGILSDWVPAFMQESLKSPLLMGLVMSFSSLVGFFADLIFPEILKFAKTKKIMAMAIGTSLVFSGLLLWSIAWPMVVIFLVAMAVWGLYYEFLGFGGQQFVSENVPVASRSSVWAVLSVFKSMAYFIGPVIGSMVALNQGNYETVLMAAGLVLLGYFLWMFWGKEKKEVEEHASARVMVWGEVKKWVLLSEYVWPILTISLVMGIVDSTFWTTGTVLSDILAESSWLGGMFLPFYMLPMIFVGIIVARWGIYKGKKKIAEIFMLIAGLALSAISLVDSVYYLLFISFLTGAALSVSWPLTDAVYTDIIERMGHEGKHMMGLSGSTISLAYIVGPIFAGLIAQFLGERMTFSVMGVLMVVLATFLLFVTPKKLRLPQKEIQTWE